MNPEFFETADNLGADDERFSRATEAEPEAPIVRECWRCGKFVEKERAACPFCRATLSDARSSKHGIAQALESGQTIKVLIVFFSLLLTVSIIQAWYIYFGSGLPAGPKREQEIALLHQMVVLEVFDSILVLLAIYCASAPAPVRQSRSIRVKAWLFGSPMLGALLAVNLLYCATLQEYIGRHPHLETIEINFRTGFWLVLIAVCIQPAVIEELFFRYLALGHLRAVMSDHGAVWVSAIMFGFAHLYNPLGIPVLIVIGAGFGYMRLMSGGMLLPMLMHGLHNALVLWMEGNG